MQNLKFLSKVPYIYTSACFWTGAGDDEKRHYHRIFQKKGFRAVLLKYLFCWRLIWGLKSNLSEAGEGVAARLPGSDCDSSDLKPRHACEISAVLPITKSSVYLCCSFLFQAKPCSAAQTILRLKFWRLRSQNQYPDPKMHLVMVFFLKDTRCLLCCLLVNQTCTLELSTTLCCTSCL